MKQTITALFLEIIVFSISTYANEFPDIRSIQPDLVTPKTTTGSPSAGKRVKQTIPEYKGKNVYYTLYLPMNWQKGKQYSVLVEYAGNGPYKNKYGDICTGNVEDCSLGYGISDGKDFIWACLPYISKEHTHNQRQWWGDAAATVEYCKKALPRICHEYGGDISNMFLIGFSRGSIACNFIGLYDNEIASLWRGFVCHSHYDGVRKWNYYGADRESARIRLERLKDRPQFISHEGSVEETKKYLNEVYPHGRFTFLSLPYRNHTDTWVLRDIPERKWLRNWIWDVLNEKRETDSSNNN